ncbi:MAG: twitching motility protein PilT [Desulfitobacteriaceae bacterium]
MNKIKIYLDTSVISHLEAEDTPEKMQDTLQFWQELKKGKYIVSWNFKHFVNIKTINKVQAVNKLLDYSEISILPPSMMLEGEE